VLRLDERDHRLERLLRRREQLLGLGVILLDQLVHVDAGAAAAELARGVVDAAARVFELALAEREQQLGRDVDAFAEAEQLHEAVAAERELAVRARQQLLLQPRGEVVERARGVAGGGAQLVERLGIGHALHRLRQRLDDERARALRLLDRAPHRHVAGGRTQAAARVLEHDVDLPQARVDRAQTIGRGQRVGGDELEDRRLHQIAIDHRVALEGTQLGQVEQRGLGAALEQEAVERVIGVEGAIVGERTQRLDQVAQALDLARLRLGADVVDAVVVAVHAEPGRGDGGVGELGVEIVAHQGVDALVGAAAAVVGDRRVARAACGYRR
jgi:hypothetical protein